MIKSADLEKATDGNKTKYITLYNRVRKSKKSHNDQDLLLPVRSLCQWEISQLRFSHK